jgi:hypothetical protein
MLVEYKRSNHFAKWFGCVSDLAVTLPGIYPAEMGTYALSMASTAVFTAALFMMPNVQHFRHPSIVE